MSLDLAELKSQVSDGGKVARVVIVKTAGSVPRETGASMIVWPDGQSGTIGGGALEFQAAREARRQLALGTRTARMKQVPLGPGLGQCCGGSVTLLTEIFDIDSAAELHRKTESGVCIRSISEKNGNSDAAVERLRTSDAEIAVADGCVAERLAKPKRSVWIYGAGHVGRAIVSTLAPMPQFGLVWLDVDRARFPERCPDNVDILVAKDLAMAAAHAPDHGEHLVLTYSHTIDLEICGRILTRSFRSAGLIGSSTKWARFRKRLIESGHDPKQVDRISCPIGDVRLGKHPQAIAVGVAAALLSQPDQFLAGNS